MKDKFEKSFGDFIDCKLYDDAENAVFALVRAAFTAGWIAAGGNMPNSSSNFETDTQEY